MAYKISVDKEKCIGCGYCTSVCPKSFEMKGGKSHVKVTNARNLTCEKQAEQNCPTHAIEISEE